MDIYVITEPCVGTCDTACVDVCPMDCIHGPLTPEQIAGLSPAERDRQLPMMQLYINPEECIGCGACEVVCPVQAIFAKSDVPDVWHHFIERNARFFSS